ncbi:MAG: S46 family peptidase [Spirochaetota bacterium]
MWTFDNLPYTKIEKQYGFKVHPEWLQKIQLSAVRFSNGGSGSFVSPNGLVITNHHVAIGQLQKLSHLKINFMKDGYVAKNRKEEIFCPNMEINVLISFENITRKINQAIKNNLPPSKRVKQKNSIMAKLKKESFEKTGLRSDIVTLYNGGEYWLYRYKQYTDVRLVMAPELQAAAFGGDYDNFHYPRFSLDFAFFRIYENGKPIQSKNYFSWTEKSVRENQLVFVAGHPGKTSRQKTLYEIEFTRDTTIPTTLQYLRNHLKIYQDFIQQYPPKKQLLDSKIYYFHNARKSLQGKLQNLQKESIVLKKKTEEEDLKKFLRVSRKVQKKYGSPWQNIATAIDKKKLRIRDFYYTTTSDSKLATYALQFIFHAYEQKKPNNKRLRSYQDSALKSLKLRLTSNVPIDKEMEEFLFRENLSLSIKMLGSDHPYIKLALRERTAKLIARLIFKKTKLADATFRKNLFAKGSDYILQSKDPFLLWAKSVAPFKRKFLRWKEKTIDNVLEKEGKKLAKLRFELYGKKIYPDATFSLRLSYGKVLGYEENTSLIPYQTTFYGLFDRSSSFINKPPFHLSKAILQAKTTLSLETPLNFISTNDITGGNSGSPVFSQDLKFMGIVFDGNKYSHAWDYIYSDNQGRSISVDAIGILESLEKVYQAKHILKEIYEARNTSMPK